MGRGGALRAVPDGSCAPRRRRTVLRLRERAVEASTDGSCEPLEAPPGAPEPTEADALEVREAPARVLVRENRRRGIDPGPMEAAARWKRERNIPDRVYFGALEAGFAATGPLRKNDVILRTPAPRPT